MESSFKVVSGPRVVGTKQKEKNGALITGCHANQMRLAQVYFFFVIEIHGGIVFCLWRWNLLGHFDSGNGYEGVCPRYSNNNAVISCWLLWKWPAYLTRVSLIFGPSRIR